MSENQPKPRILVVEESATLRYMIGKSIQKQGYELMAVDSFESGITCLAEANHSFQGIIVGWPNYESYQKSSELLVLLEKEPYSEVPVILLCNDAEMNLLNWMSTRHHAALIPWESYQEAVASLQQMLQPDPPDELTEDRRSNWRDNGEPTRVLFVDDSNSILTYYQRLLERNGYQVLTARSVKEAYEVALNNPVDIAIIDYFMPEENGYVLCQKLRDNPDTDRIRTAVITGTYLDEVIKDCLKAGAIECMFKNEAEELFLARLASMRRFIEVQKQIEKQRERLAAILESVGEGVYGVDTEGKITFMNPATLRLLGINNANAINGKLAHDEFHHYDEQHTIEDDLLRKSYTTGNKLSAWETVFRHHSGKLIPVECTSHPLYIKGKQHGSVVAFRDISNQKMLEQRLRWQATHDHLTKLYNRRYFELKLDRELQHVQRSGITGALIYLDLDRFKYVNDTAGHEIGDSLLQEISRVLTQQLRRNDLLARIGGDEFAVILRNVDSDAAVRMGDNFRRALNQLRVNHKEQSYVAHASVGVAMMTEEHATAGEILANADIACHIAKRSGRNQTHLYRKESDERNVMGSELGWTSRLRDALQHNGFELSYQPIMKVADIDMSNLPAQNGALWQQHLNDTEGNFHYEVLVRMHGDNGKMFFPDSFIPTAERFNMMTDIDLWVLQHALQDLTDTGSPAGKITLSLNLSGHTLDNEKALNNIRAIIADYKVPAESLVFEITETSAIANMERASYFIDELHALGCRFSLDDFGSGFCSFSQLKNLDTDFVKIDGQFVKSMARGSTDRAIVTAMNDVAHTLGRCTVAEYVESPEVVRLLKICGVDKLQGHYISAPLKALPHGNVIKLHTIKHIEID